MEYDGMGEVGIDVVYLPWTEKKDGLGFTVFARDDLSGWVEGRAIAAANAKNVAKFIYEDVICHHGCPQRIVLDRRKRKSQSDERSVGALQNQTDGHFSLSSSS